MSDRKPYIVLIGRVRTFEGSKLAGAIALLNDKDGELLTARHIVEPTDIEAGPSVLSDAAMYGLRQEPERSQATVAEMIERLQSAGYTIAGPFAPLAQQVTLDVRVDDPEVTGKHLKEMLGGSDTSIKDAGTDKPEPERLDPEQRLAAIVGAVSQLDLTVESNWLRSGAPDVKALEGLLGYHISAAERDTAWERYQAFVASQQGGE